MFNYFNSTEWIIIGLFDTIRPMTIRRIDANTPTRCGWGVYVDGTATCSINPPPPQADVNSTRCPALDVEDCSRAWGEHAYCPALRAKGAYGGSRRK
jgi:hypothetical protein